MVINTHTHKHTSFDVIPSVFVIVLNRDSITFKLRKNPKRNKVDLDIYTTY